jgi:hypothetical protein
MSKHLRKTHEYIFVDSVVCVAYKTCLKKTVVVVMLLLLIYIIFFTAMILPIFKILNVTIVYVHILL